MRRRRRGIDGPSILEALRAPQTLEDPCVACFAGAIVAVDNRDALRKAPDELGRSLVALCCQYSAGKILGSGWGLTHDLKTMLESSDATKSLHHSRDLTQ